MWNPCVSFPFELARMHFNIKIHEIWENSNIVNSIEGNELLDLISFILYARSERSLAHFILQNALTIKYVVETFSFVQIFKKQKKMRFFKGHVHTHICFGIYGWKRHFIRCYFRSAEYHWSCVNNLHAKCKWRWTELVNGQCCFWCNSIELKESYGKSELFT